MGSVSVSSYICCIFASCMHPVPVLNAVFCMTCNVLMLVENVWLYAFLCCTRVFVFRCDGDVICVAHELNWWSGCW